MTDQEWEPVITDLAQITRELAESLNLPFTRLGQCQECGAYTITGAPPLLHLRSCESSGTAGHLRYLADPEHHQDDPRFWERIMEGFPR